MYGHREHRRTVSVFVSIAVRFRCSIEAMYTTDIVSIAVRFRCSIEAMYTTTIVSIAVRFRCSIEAMYTTANVSIVFVISRCTFATYG